MCVKTALLLLALAVLSNLSTVASDSAGIVEMVDGLAYGGIPYGSVTGMVAKYPGFRPFGPIQTNRLNAARSHRLNSLILTPNLRANLYSLSTAVAPTVVAY